MFDCELGIWWHLYGDVGVAGQQARQCHIGLWSEDELLYDDVNIVFDGLVLWVRYPHQQQLVGVEGVGWHLIQAFFLICHLCPRTVYFDTGWEGVNGDVVWDDMWFVGQNGCLIGL